MVVLSTRRATYNKFCFFFRSRRLTLNLIDILNLINMLECHITSKVLLSVNLGMVLNMIVHNLKLSLFIVAK